MPETSLMPPLEALPVVAAPADTPAAPAAPEGAPLGGSAGFSRLLAIELTPEEEQPTEAAPVPAPQLPDPDATPSPTGLEVVNTAPTGKALPPPSGTTVPPPTAGTASLPVTGPSPLPTVPDHTPATAPTASRVVTSLATEYLPANVASGPTPPTPAVQGGPGSPNVIATQPAVAMPTTGETPESTAGAKPEVDASEQALLTKLTTGREPGQPSAPKASLDTTLPIGTHGVTQPAAEPSAKEAVPTPRLELPEPMRTPQWNDGLATRISWMANNQVQRAKLRVNPPELGPLEVRVAVQQDEARIVFTANNATVREAVEAALPRLRELMGTTGLNLVQVDVSAQGQDGRGQLREWAEPVVEDDP